MPVYEYLCKDCHKRITLVRSITEYEKLPPACPKCKSHKVEQLPAAFFAVTAKKS